MVCKIILACYQGMGESSAVSFTVEHDGLWVTSVELQVQVVKGLFRALVSSVAMGQCFLLAKTERLERLLLHLLLGTWTMASFYCKTLLFRKYKNGWSVCAQYGMLRCLHWEKSVKLASNRWWQFTLPPFHKLRRQDGWERIGLSWVIAMTRMNNQGQWRLSCDQG